MARMPMHMEKWPVPGLPETPRPRKFDHDLDWKKIVRKAPRVELQRYLQSIRLTPLQIYWALDDRAYAIKVIDAYKPAHVETPKIFRDRVYDFILLLGKHLP